MPQLGTRSGAPACGHGQGPPLRPRLPHPPPERARGGLAGAASDGSAALRSAANVFPDRRKERRPYYPASCPSRSRPRHAAPDWCGAWPGPFQPRPPRMDRPGGRGGSGRARPAVSERGRPGGRAFARRLPRRSLARSLARAPSRRLWGSPGGSSARRHRHRLVPTSCLVPSWLSSFLSRAAE